MHKRSLCISAKLGCNVVKACIILHIVFRFCNECDVPFVSITSQSSSTATARSYLVSYICMYLFDVETNPGRSTPTTRHEGHRRNYRDRHCMCELALFLLVMNFSMRSRNLEVCLVCMCFYGAYNYSGLPRQVSEFRNVSASA